MKQQLVKFDKNGYDAELSHAKRGLKAYNNLLKELAPFEKTAGLKLDKKAISDLLADPEAYAFDAIIMQNDLSIGGVKMAKIKAIDLIEFPDVWMKIIGIAQAFTKQLHKAPKQNSYEATPSFAPISLHYLEMANNQFVISATYLAQLKEKYSQFTTSDTEVKALELSTTLNNCLLELQKMGIGLHHEYRLNEIGYHGANNNGNYSIVFDPTVIVDKVRQANAA